MDKVAIFNLMSDVADNKVIYDVDLDREMSKEEVNKKIADLCFEYTGLTSKSTDKQVKRALQSEKAREFFAIIEEIVEKKIQTGLKESEFFNDYVEMRNVADGDEDVFWNDGNEIILQVEKVSGSHHDLEFNRARVA